MTENRFEIFVGVLVLAVATLFLFYLVPKESVTGDQSQMQLTASFSSAQGIAIGSDVKMSGIKIGFVSGIVLNPETYAADLELSIRDDLLIPDDSSAIVAAENLLGGHFIDILPGGSFINLEQGEKIVETQGSIDITEILTDFFFDVQ